MHIPSGCKPLSETTTTPQIRLGIQGFPGTGKTFAALTFPNAVVLNLDRGLGAHIGRNDVIEVPLYSIDFVKQNMKMPAYHPSALKEVIVKWIESEGRKLAPEQTLVVDGLSDLEIAYHRWFTANSALFLTKSGTVDGFAEWTVKKTYFGELGALFKELACNVILLTHEVDLKDKNGVQGPVYSGKIRPLLTGAAGDALIKDFSDWFRQHAIAKPTDFANIRPEQVKADWGITVDEFKKLCASTPTSCIYAWQTQADNIFDAKASSLNGAPKFIPATYESFLKYRRQISRP